MILTDSLEKGFTQEQVNEFQCLYSVTNSQAPQPVQNFDLVDL